MRTCCFNLKPDCIEDVIALIALYRPGPMSQIPDFTARKQGRTKITHEFRNLKIFFRKPMGSSFIRSR